MGFFVRWCCWAGACVAFAVSASAQEPILSVSARQSPGDWSEEQVRQERLEMLDFLALDSNTVGERAVTTVQADPDRLAELESGATTAKTGLPLLGVHFPINESISIDGMTQDATSTSKEMTMPDQLPLVSGGVFHPGDAGEFRWSKAYDSPGATGLRLHLEEMDLPAGAAMYVYGFGEEFEAHGPYTGRGVNNDGSMWTNTVFADRIYLEVQGTLPVAKTGATTPFFKVVELAHLGGPYVASDEAELRRASDPPDCLVDVSCAGSEFAHMNTVKYAVAYMSIPDGNSHGQCTGTLVADDTDYPPGALNIPYFLTAYHCMSTTTEAAGLECFFRYFTPSCGAAAPTLQSRPRTLGSTLLKTRSSNDMTFLRLAQNPPGGSVFLGWTTQSFADKQDNLHRLSHPAGLPMKYDREANFSDPYTYYRCKSLSEFHYTRPRVGTTAGGSSGSALVTADMKIAGQLYGKCYWYSVPDGCDYDEFNNVSGKFSKTLPVISEWLVTPPPPHDNFQSRIVLTGTEGSHEASTKNGTRQTGEPAHALNTTSATVWYQWTAPAVGNVIFSTCTDTLYDTILAAYTGSTVSTLTRISESDDFCDTKSRLLFSVVPGQTYHIAVAGWNVEQGRFTLRWTFNGSPIVVVVNEPANNANTVNSHISVEGTYSPLTVPLSRLEYRLNGGAWLTNVNWGTDNRYWQFLVTSMIYGQNRIDIRARDAYWTYGPIETRYVNRVQLPTVTVTSHSTGLTYLIPHIQTSVVISGTAAAPGSTVSGVAWLTEEDPTVRQATGTTSWQFEATNLRIGNTTFHIRSQSAQGVSSLVESLTIRRDFIPPPNDSFSSATALPGAEGSTQGWTTLGSRQTGEPMHAVTSNSPSVWYRWMAPQDGDYFFSTCEHATYDTALAAYTGSLITTLVLVAENDDALGDCGARSRIGFHAQAGSVYRIAVAGATNDSGSFTLTYGLIPPPTVEVTFPTATRVTIPEDRDAFTFEGIASSEWPVDRVIVRRDSGSWLQATGTDAWRFTTYGIPYGDSLYAFRAVNALGTEGPMVLKYLRRLRPPPQVIISIPTEEEILVPNATTLYSLAGGAFATETSLMGVEWRKNGGNWTTQNLDFDGANYWWLNGVPIDPGDNLIEIRTQDQTLRYSEIVPRTITRVWLLKATVLNPSKSSVDVPYAQTTYPFSGSVDAEADGVEWRIRRGVWQDLTYKGTFWNFQAGPLIVGENQVDVRARNIFGEYGPVATRRVYRLETPFVKGDVNQDGVVNVADVTLMSLFLDQIAELPDPTLADMDGNGKIGKPDLDLLVDQIVN